MSEILIDTAKGGHACYWCGLPLAPDEPQIIVSDGSSWLISCEDCVKSGQSPWEGL